MLKLCEQKERKNRTTKNNLSSSLLIVIRSFSKTFLTKRDENRLINRWFVTRTCESVCTCLFYATFNLLYNLHRELFLPIIAIFSHFHTNTFRYITQANNKFVTSRKRKRRITRFGHSLRSANQLPAQVTVNLLFLHVELPPPVESPEVRV